MSFYSDMAATATALLTEFGAATTLGKISVSAYDPNTGANTVTSTPYTTVAAVFDIEQRDIDGTLIKYGDRRAYISVAGSTPVPVTGDTLTFGGVTHTVILVKNLAPAGTAVIYEAVIRV